MEHLWKVVTMTLGCLLLYSTLVHPSWKSIFREATNSIKHSTQFKQKSSTDFIGDNHKTIKMQGDCHTLLTWMISNVPFFKLDNSVSNEVDMLLVCEDESQSQSSKYDFVSEIRTINQSLSGYELWKNMTQYWIDKEKVTSVVQPAYAIKTQSEILQFKQLFIPGEQYILGCDDKRLPQKLISSVDQLDAKYDYAQKYLQNAYRIDNQVVELQIYYMWVLKDNKIIAYISKLGKCGQFGTIEYLQKYLDQKYIRPPNTLITEIESKLKMICQMQLQNMKNIQQERTNPTYFQLMSATAHMTQPNLELRIQHVDHVTYFEESVERLERRINRKIVTDLMEVIGFISPKQALQIETIADQEYGGICEKLSRENNFYPLLTYQIE